MGFKEWRARRRARNDTSEMTSEEYQAWIEQRAKWTGRHEGPRGCLREFMKLFWPGGDPYDLDPWVGDGRKLPSNYDPYKRPWRK